MSAIAPRSCDYDDDDVVDEKENDVSHDEKDLSENTATVRGSTVLRRIYAIFKYARFLGYDYAHLDKTTKQMSRRSLNQLESEFLQMYFEYNTTSNILNMTISLLRARQVYIDEFMIQTMQGRNDEISRYDFGENELMPFLEICVRLLVVPLEPVLIRNTVFYRGHVDGMGEFVKKNRPCVYYDRDRRICIAYMVASAGGGRDGHRLTNVKLTEELCVYMDFYLHQCRPDVVTDRQTRNRRHRHIVNNFMFVSSRNGAKCKDLIPRVRQYCIKIGIDPGLLQLVPGHRYSYYTKLLWILRQVYMISDNPIMDISRLSHFGYVAGISLATGQSTSHYHSLGKARALHAALKNLSYDIPAVNIHIVTLAPICSSLVE